jgi:hypothetical protein
MFKNTIRSLMVAVGLVAALGMTIGTAGTAFAANTQSPGVSNNTDATLVLTGGNLTISAPTTLGFTTFALDGAAHPINTGSFNLAVIDARGTGVGWHVQLSATTFAGTTSGTLLGGNFVADTNALPTTGTLSVTNVVETMTDSTGTDVGGVTIAPGGHLDPFGAAHSTPTSTAVSIDTSSMTIGTGALTDGTGTITGAIPSTIFNTASGYGMGPFQLVTTLNLDVPANTKADTYQSAITVAVVTGLTATTGDW